VEREATKLLGEANALASQGRYEDAIAAYEHAIASAPELRGYRLVVGEMLFELQRYEAAALVFEEVALEDPQRAQAFEALARARQLLGDSFGAIAAADRAVSLAPQWADALYLSAQLCAEADMHEEARTRLDRALALDPRLVARATEDGLR
jgi:tetratricopeptide (TPR) repeat protein